MSNAGAHLLPEAGATQERTLEAVRCSAWFGALCPCYPQLCLTQPRQLRHLIVCELAYESLCPDSEQHLDNLRRKGLLPRLKNARSICLLDWLFCLELCRCCLYAFHW